ncbi:MAG: hypothetical protein K9H11_14915, partial [Rhodospirillum sp.]|nr:hypothetical protein [Rhodospirillum sp.]
MTDVCLVLIETSGNQRFIFDTRKLRENVGASEAIHRATGQTVIHAARSLRGETGACPSAESWILDPSANPPIEDAAAPAEVIIAASGKALVLVRDPEVGRTLVATVTETAIRTTPGLAARGAVSAPFPFGVNRLHGEIKALHRTLEHVETDLAGQAGRFQALPLSQTC